MQLSHIYSDISRRTGGDIYIGVVGPVRTGKSTFIKRFMETVVLPNIDSESRRERATDELPQSAAGRTIMTTEPKFIPEEAVRIHLDDKASLNVRLIDCVGYIVPSSLGYIEDEEPRMVLTPWYDQPIPFNMAAEIGTRKVITEHSTIGLVVTTDGSISDIPREEYQEAEERVIGELKELGKPFVVLLNCVHPEGEAAQQLRAQLQQAYEVPVLAVSCLQLGEEGIRDILATVLYQFPVQELGISLPRWILSLEKDHWLRQALCEAVQKATFPIARMGQIEPALRQLDESDAIQGYVLQSVDFGAGSARVAIRVDPTLFYQVLSEETGLSIQSEEALLPLMLELAKTKKEYDKFKDALEEVRATGYGIVMPALEELTLEQPEIVRQGGRYGVRLRASAPSIHMMRADISTEVSPIVGSESQSEELVHYLLSEFEGAPERIWQSNIFGKSLHELVNDGLHNKLYRMPADARLKLQETLERIINEGCSGLICIIL